MSTTTSHRPPSKPLDLELTIISAKHLKNVNWKNGDLSPYVIFWLDPNHRLATKSDDINSTKPVWNERFIIPIPPGFPSGPTGPTGNILTLEVFHSKPSDTPKPLVGTLRVPIDTEEDSSFIKTFDLHRPSGRPNGKIRLKLVIRPRPVPDYQITPPHSYYYQNTPPQSPANYSRYSPSLPPPPLSAAPPGPSPPPPQHSYHYGLYSDPYSGYYSQGGYYAQPPMPQTPRPYTDRYGGGGGVGAGPSAPVDYAQYDQKQKSGKLGLGLGLGVGAVAGGIGGLAIDEGLRYEEKVAESEVSARELDYYSDYRRRADY